MCNVRGDERGLFEALVGDGRPLLAFTGLALILSGGFALFQSMSGQFLPHDVQFLGMTSEDLCRLNQCRIVHFMFHDRVSFGGAIIAVGSLYLWMAEFPLKQGEAWAWWLFVVSGTIGFGSFLAYLGYHYLDTWHGVATLLLLPCFMFGLYRSRRIIHSPAGLASLLRPGVRVPWASRLGAGRACLLATACALIAGGFAIMVIGSTTVFVPQDLQYMGLNANELNAINPRLIALIAHDRAGFGGGLCCTGITVLFCVWCGTPSRSLWQVLAVVGLTGFATAIGIHPIIGYVSVSHLLPAIVAAVLFLVGLTFTFRPMNRATTL
ncbi:MAG TPA: hypothetical protein VIM11_08445 [Tepidisphaeraceae bacterium]|jgi:hypothetical protein